MIPAVTKRRSVVVTFDPAKTQSGQTLSNGNLTISATTAPSGANRGTQSTTSHSTGKFYVEFTDNNGTGSLANALFPGVCDSSCNGVLSTATNYTYGNWDNGYGLLNGNIDQTLGAGNFYVAGDVISVALDCASGGAPIIKFYKNNALVMSFTGSGWTAPYFIFAAAYSSNSTLARGTMNFGATSFSFSPPSGYTAGW